jgi:hypothetical protein
MSRALTLHELILLNLYRARLRIDQEDKMVAKVGGFGSFVGIVKAFQHPDWDDMGATMQEIGRDLDRERERAKQNIGSMRGAVDQLIAFNAAFDNGSPSQASGDSSGQQEQQPKAPPVPPGEQQNP